MSKQIFVNLPVKNLERSVGLFFTALGHRFNPRFTNEDATGMVVDDGPIYVMLLM